MEYIQEVPALPKGQRSVITLGKFNGVHRGHRKLIRRVRSHGQERNWKTIVFALSGGNPMLLTKEERRAFLDREGIDILIDAPLDEKLMSVEPEEFVREFLAERLHVAHIVVGPDFRYGFRRRGDIPLLEKLGRELGFSVEVMEKEREGGRVISSSLITEELEQGNIERVNRMLGYTFSTTGIVLHGRGLGHTIGVPTTNLRPPEDKLMPKNGVYLTRSHFAEKSYMGITNVGYKPTVGGERFLGVETYLFDCSEDLYGERSGVEFFRYLRPERKFDSLEALKEQLDRDIAEGKRYAVSLPEVNNLDAG